MNDHRLTKKEKYLLKKQRKEQESLKRSRQKTIKKIGIIAFIVLLIGGIFLLLNYQTEKDQTTDFQEKPKITVFYSPTCSCCKEYIPYLKRNGFEAEGEPTRDMLSIKEKYQISSEMESCHTSIVGDYFVEGHIPAEVIKKLLKEKPEISGIALPEMPAGSPGMSGFKTAPFKIYGLSNGQYSEFLSW